MEMKITHPFQQVSLAVLALIAGGLIWASPAPAQFDPGGTAGVTVGGGAGGLLPITELENQMGLQGTAYLRRGSAAELAVRAQRGIRALPGHRFRNRCGDHQRPPAVQPNHPE